MLYGYAIKLIEINMYILWKLIEILYTWLHKDASILYTQKGTHVAISIAYGVGKLDIHFLAKINKN